MTSRSDIKPDPLTLLEEAERRLSFARFSHAEAWALGCTIVAHGRDQSLPIAIAIWIGQQQVFHAALPGTSADLDQWLRRKAALVWRYDTASIITSRRLRMHGVQQPEAFVGLDPREYTLSGGAVPIRIAGTTVGVLAVSGVSDDTDHALAVDALTAFHADQLRERF